jgi:hypothetical protein
MLNPSSYTKNNSNSQKGTTRQPQTEFTEKNKNIKLNKVQFLERKKSLLSYGQDFKMTTIFHETRVSQREREREYLAVVRVVNPRGLYFFFLR